nr:hypothetical protein [Nitrospirillum amazonense]
MDRPGTGARLAGSRCPRVLPHPGGPGRAGLHLPSYPPSGPVRSPDRTGLFFWGRDANQEHGVLHWAGAAGADLEAPFPIGTQLRVFPNHACATAAQFDAYTVLPREGGDLQRWDRFNGW